MIRRIARASALSLTIGALAACSHRVDESNGSQSAAVWGGSTDLNTPIENIVVRVGNGCSGVLITPRLALTAAHCVNPNVAAPSVSVGVSINSPIRTVNSSYLPIQFGQGVPTGPVSTDIALTTLDQWILSEAKSARPMPQEPPCVREVVASPDRVIAEA